MGQERGEIAVSKNTLRQHRSAESAPWPPTFADLDIQKERLAEADMSFHRGEYERLRGELQTAHEASALPETPRGSAALHDLLVRVRLR